MIKKLIFKIGLYSNRIRKSSNPKDFAAIHATVLSIMVGVFSAYFLYINGVINTKKSDAMSIAENINDIQFGRWFYFPDDENFILPSDSSDIGNLIQKNIIGLSILSSSTPGGRDITGIEIPTDPAERAKEIVGIMNIIAHRYPFPKAIDAHSGGHSQFSSEPIIFTDFEQLCQWSNDIDKVMQPLKLLTNVMPIFYPEHLNAYLQALFLKEKDNILKSKDDLSEQIRGERNPYTIANTFIKKMQEVENIYYKTSVEIKRVNELQSRLAPKHLIFLILFSGFIVFVIGVLLPLTSFRLNPLLYVHLPLLYYSIIYILVSPKFSSIMLPSAIDLPAAPCPLT